MWLSHTRLVPVPVGQGSSVPYGAVALQGLLGRSLRGRGPVIPCIAGAQQGLKGDGLGGGWISQRSVGLALGWGPAQMRGGDPGGRGSSAIAKRRVSGCGVGPGAGGQCG
jgi:hypothetical protein